MIPYEDLVSALANWRARQGLPVDLSAPPVGGPRAAPPPKQAAVLISDSVEVDDAALLEEGYDPESDFGNLFSDGGAAGEATSVGTPPRAPDNGFESNTPPPRRGGRNDW